MGLRDAMTVRHGAGSESSSDVTRCSQGGTDPRKGITHCIGAVPRTSPRGGPLVRARRVIAWSYKVTALGRGYSLRARIATTPTSSRAPTGFSTWYWNPARRMLAPVLGTSEGGEGGSGGGPAELGR